MTTGLHKEQVFDVINWPVLALAAPISGVASSLILANIAYRLWSTGLINAAVVVVLTVVSMLLVGLLVWNLPKGKVRLGENELIIDRSFFLGRQARISQANLTLVRWFPDRTLTPRGVQLWVSDEKNNVRIGVASQPALDDFEQRSPPLLKTSTTRMPHAQLSQEDFTTLVDTLQMQGYQLREATDGAD